MKKEVEPADRTRESIITRALLAWNTFVALRKMLFGSASERLESAVTGPSVAVEQQQSEKKGRGDDELKRGPELSLGTFLLICAFAVAMAGGVGFMLVYWNNGTNFQLGGMLALTLGGFGLAFVISAHLLMLKKEAVEPREVLPSPPDERAFTLEQFRDGVQDIHRRSLLKWMGAIGTGMAAAMVVSLLRSLERPPTPSLVNTVWKRGQRLTTSDGKPVSVDALQEGSSITVFPEDKIGSEKAQTILVRVKEQYLQLPSDRADWAPKGYLAYSRVCTHAGCNVALFEAKQLQLLCPCHQSSFNVIKAAEPSGGPAARPLPQLPLYTDEEGYLRAGGGFSEPPGPGYWGMP